MAVADAPVGPVSRRYPVHVQADPQPAASRWLWLVKWLLAIPHYVVLAFLWIAFMVLSIVALRRDPLHRPLPPGDLRLQRRRPALVLAGRLLLVRRAGHGPLPAVQPGRRARLPRALRRRLPRAPVPGAGAGQVVAARHPALHRRRRLPRVRHVGGPAVQRPVAAVWGGGLVGILVLVAAVLLAFTGSYPRPLYDLLLGVNRWVLRVAAYVSLMTDEYPPFRLDMGGEDPGRRAAAARRPAAAAASPPPHRRRRDPVRRRRRRPAGAPRAAGSRDPPPGRRPPAPWGRWRLATGERRRAPRRVGAGPPGWNAGRSISVVAGSLLAVVAVVLLVGGSAVLVANRTMRDNGYLTSPTQSFSSAGSAVVVGDLLLQGPDADATVPAQVAGTVRVRATPQDAATPVFIGIGHAAAVDTYLAGVARTLRGTAGGGARDLTGGAPSTPPAVAGVWDAQSTGPGQQVVFWTPHTGRWSMVLMNTDGTGPVTANIDVGVSAPWLAWVGGLLVAAGIIVLVAAAALIVVAVHRASRPR